MYILNLSLFISGTIKVFMVVRYYVDLSGNFVVICMTLTLTRRHKDLTSQRNYLTSIGRNMTPYCYLYAVGCRFLSSVRHGSSYSNTTRKCLLINKQKIYWDEKKNSFIYMYYSSLKVYQSKGLYPLLLYI